MKLIVGILIGFLVGTVLSAGAQLWDDPYATHPNAWDYQQQAERQHRSTELQFQQWMQQQQMRPPC